MSKNKNNALDAVSKLAPQDNEPQPVIRDYAAEIWKAEGSRVYMPNGEYFHVAACQQANQLVKFLSNAPVTALKAHLLEIECEELTEQVYFRDKRLETLVSRFQYILEMANAKASGKLDSDNFTPGRIAQLCSEAIKAAKGE